MTGLKLLVASGYLAIRARNLWVSVTYSPMRAREKMASQPPTRNKDVRQLFWRTTIPYICAAHYKSLPQGNRWPCSHLADESRGEASQVHPTSRRIKTPSLFAYPFFGEVSVTIFCLPLEHLGDSAG